MYDILPPEMTDDLLSDGNAWLNSTNVLFTGTY